MWHPLRRKRCIIHARKSSKQISRLRGNPWLNRRERELELLKILYPAQLSILARTAKVLALSLRPSLVGFRIEIGRRWVDWIKEEEDCTQFEEWRMFGSRGWSRSLAASLSNHPIESPSFDSPSIKDEPLEEIKLKELLVTGTLRKDEISTAKESISRETLPSLLMLYLFL